MSNYIHDLADRVLGYRATVQAWITNPAPPLDPDDYVAYLDCYIDRPDIPADADNAFDQLASLLSPAPPAMDRISTLYVKTIFPDRLKKYSGSKSSATDIERSVHLAEDLVALKYLFDEPQTWPEHKLLSVSKGFPEDEAENALDAFYSARTSDSLLDYFKYSDGWIYKPSYGELVTLRVPVAQPSDERRLLDLCADIVRICERHGIHRFRKTRKNRIEFVWDFLRFERPDKNATGVVRVVMPPWLAGSGMKDHFPRKALAVVLKQEQRKAIGLSRRSNAKFVPDDVLLEACSIVHGKLSADGQKRSFNQLYEMINDECAGICGNKLSTSQKVAVGKTIINRLDKIDPQLKAAFVGWRDAIKAR